MEILKQYNSVTTNELYRLNTDDSNIIFHNNNGQFVHLYFNEDPSSVTAKFSCSRVSVLHYNDIIENGSSEGDRNPNRIVRNILECSLVEFPSLQSLNLIKVD